MPIYIYEHPKTKKRKEIFQSMKEDHVYEENGIKWNRVFTSSCASIDTEIDPFSAEDFEKKTANKKGTYGDLMDRSREMGLKRKDKDGVDLVRKAYYENWSKERNGKIHPHSYRED